MSRALRVSGLLACTLAGLVQAAPVSLELVSAIKIWDRAPHNAFTDLIRWHGKFYCAFREGRGHVSTDGRIRVLESDDADRWAAVNLAELEGYDLRDAHLCATADDRLMLLGGAAPRKKDNQSAPTGTFVSFSADGTRWSAPRVVVAPGRWLWQVSWHDGRAYGVAYGDDYIDLLASNDGLDYRTHVHRLLQGGYPCEAALRFDDGTCYALVRREGRGTGPASALLGVSKGDYTKWRWRDLGPQFNSFGGPNLIKIPPGHWIGAGRMHQGAAHTALTYIDVARGTMTRLLKLPSGGDTSYPGLVWHEGVLYVSYYSSHEGKAAIYLAKVRVQAEQTFGAEGNPTGSPIGGGDGYRRPVHRADYRVSTRQQLLAALAEARAGQTVYVEDGAETDLSGLKNIIIGAGVTLAGGRGKAGSPGALLYSAELDTAPLFSAGANVRVTGLRLRGPDQQRRTEQMRQLHRQGRYYSIPNSNAIATVEQNLEVDNCELFGWSHAAVFLKKGARGARIHHNYMHHNQRSGLGYGVCLDQAEALIEANLFDFCRHHIAGTGRPGTSYEARYNLVLENANGHSFDMHGGADRKDGTDTAGDSILIHHNTFKATCVRAIVIRGRPAIGAEIHDNWFLHAGPAEAIAQTNASGNVNIGPNQYAPARVVKD